ncbi:MAG: hypothetical protein QOE76_2170 [Frankiales bacterium]|nr:hypothetical protein [Frankiales bacterium]
MTTNYQEPGTAEVLPGVRLGLPAHGAGSVASFGRRFAGLLVDVAVSYGLAALFAASATPGSWSSVVFLVETVVLLAVAGQTVGMAVVRVHVVSLDSGRIHPWWALIRQVLLLLMIPALVTDSDRRGLHDKVSRVAVVNNG